MREVEKAGTNGRSAVRKSRYLSRVVQLEVLEELLERDHCELVLPVPLRSLTFRLFTSQVDFVVQFRRPC